jgi:cytochrome c
MRKTAVVVTSALFGVAATGLALASEDLAKKNGCTGCHAVDAKKAGPSFKSIAEKNKGKADAEATLVAKLGDSKKHPANKASAADRTALVKWILSL